MAGNLESLGLKYGTKIAPTLAKYLYNTYVGGQAAASGAGAGATAGAGAAGSAAQSGLGGMTVGSWATLAAPLLMTYLAYTGGSHANTPKILQNEGVGASRWLADKMAGKTGNYDNPETYGQQEGLDKYLRFGAYGDMYNRPGKLDLNEPDDYSKWTPKSVGQVFREIMDRSKYSGGKEINNSITPQQWLGYMLNDLGMDEGKLAQEVGVQDFSGWDQPDFNYLDWAKANPVKQDPLDNVLYDEMVGEQYQPVTQRMLDDRAKQAEERQKRIDAGMEYYSYA